MSGVGAFVGGLFDGINFGMGLMKARNDLEIQTMTIDAAKKAQAAADRDVAAGKPGVSSGPVPNPVPVEAPPEAKPALAPDKTGTQTPAVATALTDKIAPLVAQSESSNRPYVGYTPPDQLARGEGWTDLSKTPTKEGNFGFPDWAGAVNPETGQRSTASGLYGITLEKWQQYAPKVSVNDFSPESQRKVFDAIYTAEGVKPWNANRNLIATLGQQNLLGGTAAPAVAPAAPSALGGGPTPAKPPSVPSSATATDPAKAAQDKAKAAQQKAVSTISNAFGGATQTAQQKTEPVMPPKTSMAEIPAMAAVPPRMAAAMPATDSVGQSMVSSPQASALGVAPPVTVQGPQRGAVLASMRQDTMQLPPPPGQRPRVFRMPNGALVDGIGNIVRPSALYPSGTDNA